MNKITIGFIMVCLLILQSCKSTTTSNATLTKEVETYHIVYKGQVSPKKNKEELIIKDNDSFTNLISELNISPSEYEVLLNINFDKNNLVVLFLGEKPTGGYDIDVQKVLFLDKTIEIYSKSVAPEKDAMTTMVITSPYVMVTVPKGKEIIIK